MEIKSPMRLTLKEKNKKNKKNKTPSSSIYPHGKQGGQLKYIGE